MALYFPTQDELNKIIKGWSKQMVFDNYINYQGFVSPTFFLLKGQNVPRLNYYSTREAALKQLMHLASVPGYAVPQNPAGSVSFKADGSAQTAGVNVDFFVPVTPTLLIPVNYGLYKYVATNTKITNFIVRFNKVADGTGPFYAIINTKYFGAAATLQKGNAEKVAAADKFYRNLDIIKAQYNALVATLNDLSARPVDNATQGAINRLSLRRAAFLEEMKQIPGITIITGSSGAITGIGIVPLVYVVAIAVIGAAGWGLSTWLKETEKTERIKQSFNHQAIIAEQQQQIIADAKAGKINDNTAQVALKNLGVALETGKDVANNSSQNTKGLFGEIGDTLKWVVIGVIVIKGMEMVNQSKRNG